VDGKPAGYMDLSWYEYTQLKTFTTSDREKKSWNTMNSVWISEKWST